MKFWLGYKMIVGGGGGGGSQIKKGEDLKRKQEDK